MARRQLCRAEYVQPELAIPFPFHRNTIQYPGDFPGFRTGIKTAIGAETLAKRNVNVDQRKRMSATPMRPSLV
jgi:hypothetical protein